MTNGPAREQAAGTQSTKTGDSPAWFAEFEAKVESAIRTQHKQGMAKAVVYDQLTGDIIQRVCTSGSTCVDVGAAVGEIVRQITEAAPDGQHYAFEPVPKWAADLRRNFPGVHVIEAAASDTTGSASFELVTASPFFSGLRPQPYPFDDPAIEKITVRTVRLDEAIPSDVTVSFLKIDVEGAEVQVLRGADRLLRHDQPVIVFEHGGSTTTHEYGTTSYDLWELLVQDLSYSIYGMAGWLAGEPPLSDDQFRLGLSHGEYQFVAATTQPTDPRPTD